MPPDVLNHFLSTLRWFLRPQREGLPPIRAELCSIERLEQHGETLAAEFPISRKKRWRRPLLRRVKKNGRALVSSYRAIARSFEKDRTAVPAVEWLLDNFYIVQEQIRQIREELPPGYYRKLPTLTTGPFAGYPRIFALGWTFVANTDSHLDPESLRRFIVAYQKKATLDIGEIWACSISLRIVFIENLRRLAERMVQGRFDRQRADDVADRLLGLRKNKRADAEIWLRRFERQPLSRAFTVQLLHRLRDQNTTLAPVWSWLENRLAEKESSPEQIIAAEHQDQTAMNASVRNIITSMRLLSSMDWAQFFEDVSLVEHCLRAETAYGKMDFASRDLYRHAIEDLSRGSPLSEMETVHRIVRAARDAGMALRECDAAIRERHSDPGYFLLSSGRASMEVRIGFRVPFRSWLMRRLMAVAAPAYLGALTCATIIILAVPACLSLWLGENVWLALYLVGLAHFPASELATSLVNRVVSDLLKPRPLPKLDYSAGIPKESATLLVVPMLLTGLHEVDELVSRLESHFLGNSGGYIQFGLATDFTDADAESRAEDEALLTAARAGIERLNLLHGPAPEGFVRFHLLHRRRVWNAAEGVWMGWERKRGKLHELNCLLRGDRGTTFVTEQENLVGILPGIRYVITLDSDTRMIRGTASRLAGALAHPLNRASLDPDVGRVISGYGVMQPRITPVLPSVGPGSMFQRIYSSRAGIDPYAFAVSDVYQDLFKEGSYTGKGIYDVDALAGSMRGRVPENALLSHDLFEGLFARTALLTDVEFFDESPSDYLVSTARSHRWVRGDWQLIPHLFRARLLAIGRWKIVDNLRRSLVAPASLLLLVSAAGAKVPWVWAGFLVATTAVSLFLPAVLQFFSLPSRSSLRHHLRESAGEFLETTKRFSLWILFLPQEAWVAVDAILLSLFRLMVSRKNLLEWVSFAQTKTSASVGLYYKRMAGPPLLAMVAFLSLFAAGRGGSWEILLVSLWILAPAVAYSISQPAILPSQQPLKAKDRWLFRRIARKTWRFFETFVTAETHHLPPDNFQETPRPVVATRTSPTNIGLYFLSTLTARDFGWMGLLDTLDRLTATITTVQSLALHRGHLFNWYDTTDLHPLEPLYVSTVDSGNLAGHLWALGNACREMMTEPILRLEMLEGMKDALFQVTDAATHVSVKRRTETVTGAHWNSAVAAMAEGLNRIPRTVPECRALLSTLGELAETLLDTAKTLEGGERSAACAEVVVWCELLLRQVKSHVRDVEELLPAGDIPMSTRLADTHALYFGLIENGPLAGGERDRLRVLQRSCADAVGALLAVTAFTTEKIARMDFRFLFDPLKKLFSIGFIPGDGKQDTGFYDLLASEARLASFVAIAKGDVPATHWFRLSRGFAPLPGGLALLSWSGSMFEYLMPSLVLREPNASMIGQSNRLAIRKQMSYARENKIPWGISESAFNARDFERTYQYSSFGVPALGLKRGLEKNLVVAPYATALAAIFEPAKAARNYRRLAKLGAEGLFGFYEALDFTPSRLPEKERLSLVQAYMAHHQGMCLVAFSNVLQEGRMHHRFHAEPAVQATELLLQERLPRETQASKAPVESIAEAKEPASTPRTISRRYHDFQDAPPRTQLLSNGRYSVMLTAAGSGYSHWGQFGVTRWREDPTRDDYGTFLFLRDVGSGDVWSAGHQPRGVTADSYTVDFSDDRAVFSRRDGVIVTTMEVVVSPEDDAEIRRISVKNDGRRTREVDVTSYAEIVLATPATDMAHPAFSNLFVRTEFVPEVNGLLCSRRPRMPGELPLWVAHVVAGEHVLNSPVEYESDRARFLGRGRGIRAPLSVMDGEPLSNTVGPVLDPIVSLRRRLRIEPGETAHLAFTTLIADSREAALSLADKYHNADMFERTTALAWTQAQVQRHYLGAEPEDLHLFQDLASRILYSDRGMRPSNECLESNTRGASGLWPQGLSGDLPIVLVRIDEPEDRLIVRQLLRAHEYWRMKNLAVDLVVLNEKTGSYQQDFQKSLEALARAGQSAYRHEAHDPRGGIFLLQSDRLSPEDRTLLLATARMVLLSRQGTLADQVARQEPASEPHAPLPTNRRLARHPEISALPRSEALEFFNGLGGFAEKGREYRVSLGAGQWTPAPWINVIANPAFGFIVSECGAGYTWSENSRENKLTPWSNDPVSDPSGEILYVRDEETGDLWTPTALPIREEASSYQAAHGQGYSRFEHESHGIGLTLLMTVPLHDSIKISRLSLANRSNRSRRLSVTAFVEWVLGVSRSDSAPHIVTEQDTVTRALFARNAWNSDFAGRTAFADLSGKQSAWTGDRKEFFGRNGTLDHPAALERGGALSGRLGAGLDPCAALQQTVIIPPGGTVEVVFLLGQGSSREEAQSLLIRYRRANVDAVLAEVRWHWDGVFGAVQVRTPERAMDILLNTWLLYQTIACRLWARTGFYQAGGAFGFRDQLQDVLAMLISRRDWAREQILRAGARQFPEGDVQHWWHAPSGRGVRTRISDDLVWLPYTVLKYLEVTADVAILEEAIPFLNGPSIPDDKEDAYFSPGESGERASLFEHCARALDRSLAVGAHGLPLMGSGDWNDGMNRVGHRGKGESVWLAWFLHATLWEFAKIAEARGEIQRAQTWRLHVGELKAAAERSAWDGEWYRRAFFDDGTPLGSSANPECKIDSIAQSWSVLSGAADPARATLALASAEKHLVKREEGTILLLDPPFDKTDPSPGYIQGYLPGVRENGGQYTHAAVWMVMAFAALGDGDKAEELFRQLNPITHSNSRAGVHRYKVEPYVMAGDVYSVPPHVGRGGWTWYTGSAGWMYRAGIGSLLGFRLSGTTAFIDPCIPKKWGGFELDFRYHSTLYEVRVDNPHHVNRGIQSVLLDHQPVRGRAAIRLTDDGQTHRLQIVLGPTGDHSPEDSAYTRNRS
jgi:cyclic beta-1,2-glucan synthetase